MDYNILTKIPQRRIRRIIDDTPTNYDKDLEDIAAELQKSLTPPPPITITGGAKPKINRLEKNLELIDKSPPSGRRLDKSSPSGRRLDKSSPSGRRLDKSPPSGRRVTIAEEKKVEPTTITYSKEEINKMLDGYILVPRTLYGTLIRSEFVRFFTIDGKFHKGYFIKRHYEENNEQYIEFETHIKGENKKGYKSVKYPHKDIGRLYKKIDYRSKIEIKLISNDLMNMRNRIAKLEKQVAQLSNKK